MNDTQLALLTAELTTSTHPITTTYDADNTLAAAELMDTNIVQIKASMTGSELWANTDSTEFAALTAAKRGEWLSFCAITDHNPENNGLAHQMVNYVFPAASTTLSNLSTARNENVSQAELLGLGGVTGSLVAQARGQL